MTLVRDAFELARSGQHQNANEVATALRAKGYVRVEIEDHFAGKNFRLQIGRICREAKGRGAPSTKA